MSDTTDDMEMYCSWENLDRSDMWEAGYHTTKDGTEIDLKDMTTKHLENTIKYFKDSEDISALERELKTRKGK